MDCLFCKIVNGEIPSNKVYEDDLVIGILDINPNGEGHTLIIPKKHFLDVNDIDLEYLEEINKASKIIVKLLNGKLNPSGIRLLQNNGNLQEVKHYHLHVIPSYGRNRKKDVESIYQILTK